MGSSYMDVTIPPLFLLLCCFRCESQGTATYNSHRNFVSSQKLAIAVQLDPSKDKKLVDAGMCERQSKTFPRNQEACALQIAMR
mmetsp:Transcript_15208/g.31947  ORF Transcript_15208/g.31947 Transcript_15208/m.31947 type:complete len:84 (+) Transcript_15208:91-342(+)